MALKIARSRLFPDPLPDDTDTLKNLMRVLDEQWRELFNELFDLDTQQVTNIADIATNVADIATNVTNIATNVTNIGTNDTDIANLQTRLDSVNLKKFNGTTDADSQTTFAHGLTEANICGAVSSIYNGTVYVLNDIGSGGYAAGDAYRIYVNGSNFVIDNVGASLQSQAYRVLIFYV